MAAHRYWRVRFLPRSGNYGGCGELEMRESVGGPNVIGGGTPIASSVYSASFPAAYAYDGNTGTYWCSTNSAQNWYIGYDFGAGNEKDIYEIAWTACTVSGSLNYNPRELTVEWSDDGATWTALFDFLGIPAWTTGLTRVVNPEPGDARVAGALLETHAAAAGVEAHVAGAVAEPHLAGHPRATMGGIWLEAHTSLTVLTQALLAGAYLEVHTTVRERPILVFPYTPDGRVVETITWMTDVLPSYDGTDQRIAVRAQPRRSMTYDIAILDDAERKQIYDLLYYSSVNTIYAPAYHEQAYVKNNAAQGASLLTCNVERAALRDGAAILVETRAGVQNSYRVRAHTATTVDVNRPLAVATPKGSKIVPVFEARIRGVAELGMNALAGTSQITLDIQEYRAEEAWPDKLVELDTFDDWPILVKRPSDMTAGEAFASGIERIDFETGIQVYDTAWDQRYVGGGRQYLCNRLFDPDAIQWWRTFLDWCCGQQRPFLASTWRKDQVAGSALATTGVVLSGVTYAQLYRDSPTYQRLEIETEDGVIYRVLVASASQAGNTTVVTFADELPSEAAGVTIARISYLMLSRLGSDTVTLTHENAFTTIDLSLRAVKE